MQSDGKYKTWRAGPEKAEREPILGYKLPRFPPRVANEYSSGPRCRSAILRATVVIDMRLYLVLQRNTGPTQLNLYRPLIVYKTWQKPLPPLPIPFP